jgi:ribosome modulation factor
MPAIKAGATFTKVGSASIMLVVDQGMHLAKTSRTFCPFKSTYTGRVRWVLGWPSGANGNQRERKESRNDEPSQKVRVVAHEWAPSAA